jgi:hypothetical protein
MIGKLKYYFGPYNQVKGFRKFMELPKGTEQSDLRTANQIWESLANYILNDKQGVLRKLPFRLENYKHKAFSKIRNEIKVDAPVETVTSEKPKKSFRKMTLDEEEPNRKKIKFEEPTTPILLSKFPKMKDLSNLLTPVKTSSAMTSKMNFLRSK